MARVELLPEALEDIAGLDGSVQRMILKKLRQLANNPEQQGRPLGGRLTGLRKLVVGDRQYRIVFQVMPDGNVAVVWVIASRADSECYELAKAGLALHVGEPPASEAAVLLDAIFRPKD
jgi:mRNA interferase RelE/StbE